MRKKNSKSRRNNRSPKRNNNNNRNVSQSISDSKPVTISDDFVFLNLTCTREQEEMYFDQDLFPSTHDSAEMMLYAYVDSAPCVADLLWTKQQQGQDHFLKLTDEQSWEELPTLDFSTHEPRLF
ncbi:unnamed protein product [Mucor hiemalis]